VKRAATLKSLRHANAVRRDERRHVFDVWRQSRRGDRFPARFTFGAGEIDNKACTNKSPKIYCPRLDKVISFSILLK
jgi:hypothetical protein